MLRISVMQEIRHCETYWYLALCTSFFFFFCESPFICKLYKYIQQMV
jgi:hypothetical protein